LSATKNSPRGPLRILGQGFALGMLLQLAIGPVCLYIISTAIGQGLFPALLCVASVTFADAFFVAAAILGTGVLIKSIEARPVLRFISPVIIVLFGAYMILSNLGTGDGFALPVSNLRNWSFVSAFLLTITSPLSMVFWYGVFTERLTHHDFSKIQLPLFAAGCVSATPVFMSSVSIVFSQVGVLLPMGLIPWLNAGCGLVLAGMGVGKLIQYLKDVR
jgi:threonine/homoserine/homoserine lactone efflux protein